LDGYDTGDLYDGYISKQYSHADVEWVHVDDDTWTYTFNVYDENAKGVFFGITDKTTRSDMAYAVLEGVVFSLYHIAEELPVKNVSKIITGGGSSTDKLMAKIKAELFGCEILRAKDSNSSALGAAIIAMVGHKVFDSFEDAIVSLVKYVSVAKPDGTKREKLLKRFEIYKKLYFSLKSQFEEFSKI